MQNPSKNNIKILDLIITCFGAIHINKPTGVINRPSGFYEVDENGKLIGICDKKSLQKDKSVV